MESSESQSRETEADLLASLREHARTCHVCQPRMQPLETLLQALRQWEQVPKPVPSPGLTDRILAAVEDDRARVLPLRNRPLGNAAALLAVALQPWNSPAPRGAIPPNANLTRAEPETSPPDMHALNQAIADASDATWDLAYAASAPAVRLGRQVFDSSEGTDASSRPDLFPAGAAGELVSEALSRFGEEISAGVRPISDSARRAIEFLQESVPPTDGGADLPPVPPASKGA